MEFKIDQGRPMSRFFAVCYPGKVPGKGERIKCENPRTQETIQADYHDQFNYSWEEYPESFALMTYGLPKEKLRTALEKKYPELKSAKTFRFVLLEEIPA